MAYFDDQLMRRNLMRFIFMEQNVALHLRYTFGFVAQTESVEYNSMTPGLTLISLYVYIPTILDIISNHETNADL